MSIFLIVGTEDFENKKINSYWPSKTAPAENSYWTRGKTTFFCDKYYYGFDDSNNIIYNYEGTNWLDVTYTNSLTNLDVILGENKEYEYFIANKSVEILKDKVAYDIAGVSKGKIDNGLVNLCYCKYPAISSSGINAYGNIRPIVEIPFDSSLDELT